MPAYIYLGSFCVILQTLIIGSRYYFFDMLDKIENDFETSTNEYKLLEFYVFLTVICQILCILTAAAIFFDVCCLKVETFSTIPLIVNNIITYAFLPTVMVSLDICMSRLVEKPLLVKLKKLS